MRREVRSPRRVKFPDDLHISVEMPSKLLAPELPKFAQDAANLCKLRGTLSILITSSREMRRLNREFRGKDTPTDVLSFPGAKLPVSALAHAGDIAISFDIASANAKALGHGAIEELMVLILHGMLHLAGYDHEKDEGQMARREQSLRKKLELPHSLTERAKLSAKPVPASRMKVASGGGRKPRHAPGQRAAK